MNGWEQIALCLGLFSALLGLYALPESKAQRERRWQDARVQNPDWQDQLDWRN